MELEEENKRFFKVLIPGFHNKLKLPPSFCKKLKQEKTEWAILTSRKGSFKIKVCRNCEGVISFKVGWPKFVESHSLSMGDFVVFEHVGRLNFNVFVFGPSGCEKEFFNESNEATVNISCPKQNQSTGGGKGKENPHFMTTMRPSHKKYADLCIPKQFVRSNNLQGKTSATLRVGRGRLWPMTICARKSQNFRLSLTGGWRDFYIYNALKNGDVCVFYLKPGPPTSETIFFDVKIRHQS